MECTEEGAGTNSAGCCFHRSSLEAHLPAWLSMVTSCAGPISFTAGSRLVSAFLLCQSAPGTQPKAALRTCSCGA